MQAIIIKTLNPIYEKFITPIDQGVRDLVLRFVFVLFAAFFPLYHSSSFKTIFYTESQRHFIAAVLLFVLILFSMKAPLEKKQWNMWIMAPLFCGGMGLIITGVLHPIGSGYLVFGLMLLTVYPALYLVWMNRGDYETLFDIVAFSFVAIGLCYAAYSVALLPVYDASIESGRLKSTLMNSNLYSMVGMIVACCAMYMFARKKDESKKRMFYLLSTFVGFAMTLAGQSRASVLICIGGGIIVYLFTKKKYDNKILKRFIVICCILLLCGGGFVALLESGNTGDGMLPLLDRFLPDADGRGINGYLSGRITLWENYAEYLNLSGNDFRQTDWEALTGGYVTHAHNSFLEYGYRCGVVVSGIFMFAELIAIIIALFYLFSRKVQRDYALFCIIFVFVYFVESVIDIATIPMERYAPFLFYIALCGMVEKQGNKQTASEVCNG